MVCQRSWERYLWPGMWVKSGMNTRPSHCLSFFSIKCSRWIFTVLVLVCAISCGLCIVRAQDQNQSPNPPHLSSDAVLNHLNAVIDWYRNVMTNAPSSSQPSDTIYRNNTQSLAVQVVRFAFESAEAEARIVTAQNKANSSNSGQSAGENGGQTDFSQVQEKMSATMAELQSQIDKLNAQIAKSPASKRQGGVDQRDRLQGELELDRAMLGSIQKMGAFETTTESAANGLQGSINQLKRSVPEVFGTTPTIKSRSPLQRMRSRELPIPRAWSGKPWTSTDRFAACTRSISFRTRRHTSVTSCRTFVSHYTTR